MAGNGHIEWPEDDELVKAVISAGSIREAAEKFGCRREAVSLRLKKCGLLDDVKAQLGSAIRKVDPQGKVDYTAPISHEEQLSQRVKELEGALRRVREADTYEARVLDRLEGAAKVRGPHRIPAPKRTATRRSSPGAHEFALLFSDTHAGEVVKSEETLGMNEYNWEIMLRRMVRIRDAIVSYQDHRAFPVRKLNIWCLGDMLSGSIHDELAQTNELPDEEATIQFGYDCAEWIASFLDIFEEVHVCGVPGNHPRKNKKPQAKQAHNNSDWTAYKLMEMYHRHTDRLSFNFPRAAFLTTPVAERWRALLMHGDGIRSTMPGVPWGGVVRRVTVLEQQFAKAKQPLDYVCLGHFHTANTLDGVGVKTFLNGNVKGLDEYSLKQFGSGRAPSQLLLTFHRDRGWTDTSSIDCEPQAPAAQPAVA